MYEFTVEIAGVPLLLRCRHKVNQDFFQDYFTDRRPELEIEISDEDLERTLLKAEEYEGKEQVYRHLHIGPYLENNAIHEKIAKGLAAYDILLLHGSALSMDGQAYIFTAASGTGKSTHARLWREAFKDRVSMINDDKPLLKLQDDRVLVYGTPWDGKHKLSTNTSAPVRAIAHLVRSQENSVRALTSAEGFQILLRHSLWPDRPEERIKVLALQKKLIERLRFYELRCNMQPEAAMISWSGMQGRDAPLPYRSPYCKKQDK